MVQYNEKDKPNPGRWYVCWTGENLAEKSVGDNVPVITYSFSGSEKNMNGFYVGTTTVKEYIDPVTGAVSKSATNNCIRYDDTQADGKTPAKKPEEKVYDGMNSLKANYFHCKNTDTGIKNAKENYEERVKQLSAQ